MSPIGPYVTLPTQVFEHSWLIQMYWRGFSETRVRPRYENIFNVFFLFCWCYYYKICNAYDIFSKQFIHSVYVKYIMHSE